jgi:enamine deaminase RidA (YjgF/YER057c/UK114 family)
VRFSRILASLALGATIQSMALKGGTLPSAELAYFEPYSTNGTSKADVVGNFSLVHTTQILPFEAPGKILPGQAADQTMWVLANLRHALSFARSDISQLIKLNVYISNTNDISIVKQTLARGLVQTNKPAVVFVVTSLPAPKALVALDAVAVQRFPFQTPKLKWVFPPDSYEREICTASVLPPGGPIVYVSGMADTNRLPDATRLTLAKLMSAIGHLGLTKSDVVQLKAFFQPMSEVAVVRKAIVDFFQSNAPPCVFVEWISPPPNPPIEIELIAAGKADSTNASESVTFLTPPGTSSTKVFSRVAKVNHGNLIYISGLYGLNAQDSSSEVREIFQSLGKILKSTGSDFEHLVKATYYVSDDVAGTKLNDIRPEFFNPLGPPAASKAKVRAVGVPDKTVMVDMIAVTK